MAENPFDGGGDSDDVRIRVEAIGKPGERRFRVNVIDNGSHWIIWMEKEDLRRLGQALEQVLANLPAAAAEPLAAPVEDSAFDHFTGHQMRAAQMELGYNERTNRIVLVTHEEEENGDGGAYILRMTLDVARQLAEEAATVVAAGRPRCPLCGMPVEPDGHVCVKQNGHYPHLAGEQAPEDGEDDPAG